MSKTRTLVMVASLSIMGCANYQQTVPDLVTGRGAISAPDVKQANAYRSGMASYLRLPPRQVRVEPESGYTKVTIFGVAPDNLEQRQRIASELSALNSQNPRNPLRWRFE